MERYFVSRLYLLRHAKAGWALPGMRDFDRPLERTGRIDAEAMGREMHKRGYIPCMTLCSTALRACETLQGIACATDTGRVVLCESLYNEDAASYLATIRKKAEGEAVLVIGHNPMMEDLATAMSAMEDGGTPAVLDAGFPPAGLAVISFSAGLKNIAPGTGRLESFLTPAGI